MRFLQRRLSFVDVSELLLRETSPEPAGGYSQQFLINGQFEERPVAGWTDSENRRIPIPKAVPGEELRLTDSGWGSSFSSTRQMAG